MSEQALRGFLQQMQSDGALRGEASHALSAVAVKHGFDCPPADCERLFKGSDGTGDGELSDDALAKVSGGAGAPVVGISIGLSCSQQSTGIGGKFPFGH